MIATGRVVTSLNFKKTSLFVNPSIATKNAITCNVIAQIQKSACNI